jgi:23S rRNA (cytosine1962-C5)-methyltransferase
VNKNTKLPAKQIGKNAVLNMEQPPSLTPLHLIAWEDYQLLDSGGKEKLEKFGRYILRRPEPQAIWSKSIPEAQWRSKADAVFSRSRSTHTKHPDVSGSWIRRPEMPETWVVRVKFNLMEIQMRLKLTSSGHIGIFPEQFPNWQFIDRCIRFQARKSVPRILNLFAYTGAASLVSLAAGAEVVHLDAVKQMIHWTEQNREISGLPKKIHLVAEDALKFLRREIRRGRQYDGLIADPPSYGRGPEGEKWLFDEHIQELIAMSGKLLKPDSIFFVLNWYSIGLSPYVMISLVTQHFPGIPCEAGDMVVASQTGPFLPLGTYLRFTRGLK